MVRVHVRERVRACVCARVCVTAAVGFLMAALARDATRCAAPPHTPTPTITQVGGEHFEFECRSPNIFFFLRMARMHIITSSLITHLE